MAVGIAHLEQHPVVLHSVSVANLGDRMTGGSVVDFLDMSWWPSFNLADVALCIGSGLVALGALREPSPRLAGPVERLDTR